MRVTGLLFRWEPLLRGNPLQDNLSVGCSHMRLWSVGSNLEAMDGETRELDLLLEDSSPEVAEMTRALCELVRGACAGATETVQLGWKTVSYSRGGVMKGAICSVCPQSSWVNVQFLKGTSLKDPDGLLEGSGKTMRHVKVRSLEGVDVGAVGALVTKTLVIMGDPLVTTTSQHPRGAMLRAYDKRTGDEVGTVYMPAPQTGSPMTYMVDGQQYIVVAVSGGNYSGEYLAFRLPS